MKKILWLINSELPQIGKHRGHNGSNTCGWISSVYDFVRTHFELIVVYPVFKTKDAVECNEADIKYIAYCHSNKQEKEVNQFVSILEKVKPDLIEIWGTEFPRSKNMVEACKRLALNDRVVISMQGSSSEISLHYTSNLRGLILYYMTFRDFIRHESIFLSQQKYKGFANLEKYSLSNVNYCIGKTDWDYAVSHRINPNLQYFRCTENLRDLFYEKKGSWSIDTSEPFTVFLTQGSYPLKGLHIALEALYLLKSKYPTIKLYVSGTSPIPEKRIKIPSYGVYVKYLIKKYDLKNNVEFLGNLTEEKICNCLLQSRALINPSSMENESNSVSEARMLGVPVIASAVGGVTSRIKHGVDGFVYSYDDSHMLAYYLEMVLTDDKIASSFSKNGVVCCEKLNNREKNNFRRLEIYNQIIAEAEHEKDNIM